MIAGTRAKGALMDDLQDRWEAEAARWIEWSRAPGHDSYWRFHRDQFLPLLPPPGRQTVDIGCGEARFTRDLKALGHPIIGIDSSPAMLAAASCARSGNEADTSGRSSAAAR
jgi:SAM-dependent methyltransferase